MVHPEIAVGDIVSVSTRVWGDSWAKEVHAKEGANAWKTGRTHGIVLSAKGAKWVCNFDEADGEHAAWAKKALQFERRPPTEHTGRAEAADEQQQPSSPLPTDGLHHDSVVATASPDPDEASTSAGRPVTGTGSKDAAKPRAKSQELPFGWHVVSHDAPAGAYKVFHGPAGERARSIPEARRIAEGRPAPAAEEVKRRKRKSLREDMTAEQAFAAAEAEGLTLITAPGSKSGYRGVQPKGFWRWRATAVTDAGRSNILGTCATVEEAALLYARNLGPEKSKQIAARVLDKLDEPPRAVFEGPSIRPPLSAEEALAEAESEGLVLRRRASSSGSGYLRVFGPTSKKHRKRPFLATGLVGKDTAAALAAFGYKTTPSTVVRLGRFAAAEEAALAVARWARDHGTGKSRPDRPPRKKRVRSRSRARSAADEDDGGGGSTEDGDGTGSRKRRRRRKLTRLIEMEDWSKRYVPEGEASRQPASSARKRPGSTLSKSRQVSRGRTAGGKAASVAAAAAAASDALSVGRLSMARGGTASSISIGMRAQASSFARRVVDSVLPPPATTPRCHCGGQAAWLHGRWWCPGVTDGAGAAGCTYECVPPPFGCTPLCDCAEPLPALWVRDRWWCPRWRSSHAHSGAPPTPESSTSAGCAYEYAPEAPRPEPEVLHSGGGPWQYVAHEGSGRARGGARGGALLEVEVACATARLLTASAYGLEAQTFLAPTDCGLGLFARAALRPSQIIGEYGGPRLPLRWLESAQSVGAAETAGDADDAEVLEVHAEGIDAGTGTGTGTGTGYALAIPGTSLFIDGMGAHSPFGLSGVPPSNVLYANHSSAAPNARLAVLSAAQATRAGVPTLDSGPLELRQHVVLVASQAVAAGEEIRFDYENGGDRGCYWGEAPPVESHSWRARRVEPPPPSGEEPRMLVDVTPKRRRGEAPSGARWAETEADEEKNERAPLPIAAPLPWGGAGGGDERLTRLVPLLLRANPTNWATSAFLPCGHRTNAFIMTALPPHDSPPMLTRRRVFCDSRSFSVSTHLPGRSGRECRERWCELRTG